MADVSLQGYSFGGSSQPFSGLAGAAVSFRDFFPKFGLITGNLEGYDQNTQGRLGENFLQLKGFMWKGRRWNITGGDFRVQANLVSFPFQNYYTPQITARGVQVEMSEGQRTYTFFWGGETLSGGPRITFRLRAPQQVLGASVKQKLGNLQIGARYLHLSSADDAPALYPAYFAAGREFRSTDSLALSAYYEVLGRLRFYSDATLSRVQFASGYAAPGIVPFSWLSGVVWEGSKLVIRANYGSQSTSWLPVLGYYAGDRRGPYAEFRYKLLTGVDLYGSASQSRNNLEKNPLLPTLNSANVAAGGSVQLPWQLNLGAQYAQVNLSSQQPSDFQSDNPQGDQNFKNTESSVTLTKSFARQSVRLSLRDVTLAMPSLRQKEKIAELGDSVQFSHFTAGGSVRFQQSNTGQLQNTVFVRGTLQARFGRFTAYGQGEFGNDLVNKSLFATNTISTTVVGVSMGAVWGWSLAAEAYRNSLTAALNPESVFELSTQGQGVPSILSDLNQWSAYLRVTKRFRWGSMEQEATDKYVYDHIPLVGAVEGFVRETAGNGLTGVEAVAVQLDGSRATLTDAEGRYRFDEVSEGLHRVELNIRELPAEFMLGEHPAVSAAVKARKVARADMDVVQINGTIRGQIEGAAKDIHLNDVILTLTPGDRKTSCDGTGGFGFFNLAPGEYQVTIDPASLPENHAVMSPAQVKVTVSSSAVARAAFRIEFHEPQLPMRKVFGGQAQPFGNQ